MTLFSFFFCLALLVLQFCRGNHCGKAQFQCSICSGQERHHTALVTFLLPSHVRRVCTPHRKPLGSPHHHFPSGCVCHVWRFTCRQIGGHSYDWILRTGIPHISPEGEYTVRLWSCSRHVPAELFAVVLHWVHSKCARCRVHADPTSRHRSLAGPFCPEHLQEEDGPVGLHCSEWCQRSGTRDQRPAPVLILMANVKESSISASPVTSTHW